MFQREQQAASLNTSLQFFRICMQYKIFIPGGNQPREVGCSLSYAVSVFALTELPEGQPDFKFLFLILFLSKERRLRVFENRVLRRTFGPKRDEVTGEWRKLRNEELSDLYSLPNIVRVVKSRRM